MKKRASRLFAACAALSFSVFSQAGQILDSIRNYDLNNYALGVAVSTTQNPYIGTSTSTIAYPYLTSFRHAALIRDWLMIRGENVGVRVVTDSGWEYGVLGRIQTLGFGDVETEELSGMTERKWAVEAGPMVGWRGWPVQVQFRSYWELPNRHSGTTSELELLLPMEFEWGFFVPNVRAVFLSGDYSDFYYGVTQAEATPSRPQYQPGSALNTAVGFELGYEITPKWLLKTSFEMQFLDSVISQSPIVDRDRLWSGTVGLAYNADVFRPRNVPSSADQRKVEVRFGAVRSSVDTKLSRDAEDGAPGEEVDLEDALGLTDSSTVTQFDAFYRLSYHHRLEIGYFELERSSNRVLERDIQIGDQTFVAGTDVRANTGSKFLRLAYAYSLMRDGQKELGLRAGFGYTRFESELLADDEQQSARSAVDVPLPTLGVFGRIQLADNWQLKADVDLFVLEFDRYDGYMAYLNLDLEREFGKHFGVGAGYSFYGTRLTAKDEDLRGTLRLRHQGPRLYVSAKF